jgi:hypothetical protein
MNIENKSDYRYLIWAGQEEVLTWWNRQACHGLVLAHMPASGICGRWSMSSAKKTAPAGAVFVLSSLREGDDQAAGSIV